MNNVLLQSSPYLLEFDSQWDAVEECIDLENPQEKHPEVLEHLRKEIPEEPHVWCQVGRQ